MKVPTLILIGIAATVLLASASSQDKVNSPRQAIEESTKKIGQFQTERIAILKNVVDISFKLAENSRIELSELLEARMSLLSAELESAKDESGRITLYKQALDTLKQYEELAKKQLEFSRGTELRLLQVKARRLEVEILLEQAKMRNAKESN
ncbi:MAG: hypothetical protein JWM11_3724 [Planctomycetaceae bacterium]|nr:hypothetical protein [Planctomycetaceae bacterium]